MNYAHCKPHRSESVSHLRLPVNSPPVDSDRSDGQAQLLVDLLTDGVDAAVADRVVEYVGEKACQSLRKRHWNASDCRNIAQAAQAILDFKKRIHNLTGDVVSRALPQDLPGFYRSLAKHVAAKMPLPIDAKLEACARALQLIGIFECMVKELPMNSCACLLDLGQRVAEEEAKDLVVDLLEKTRDDLDGKVA